MPFSQWTSWQWDVATAAWATWLVWFLVWESWAVMTGQLEHTFTWHLRPLLLSHPLLWFFAFGAWLWLGVHFLAPTIEVTIVRSLGGGS